MRDRARLIESPACRCHVCSYLRVYKTGPLKVLVGQGQENNSGALIMSL